MSLAQLQITNLRNLQSLRFNFHPKLNFVLGENGSGKTSFLEAIYLLGSGHSFRTREIGPLVSEGETSLTVFARTQDEQTISLQKSTRVSTQVRLNEKLCQSSSELAHFLPCQVFHQAIFQIIDAGPSARRNVLDWGLFHLKPDYHLLWKEYKRVLKQRNLLLKQKASRNQLLPWDKGIAELSMQLHEERESYFLRLLPEFQNILTQLTSLECDVYYERGWGKSGQSESLQAILQENYSQDLFRQYTQYGAHQADLRIESNSHLAKQHLSRGQQKIVLFALKFAQAKFTLKPCIYLCDDISSELDKKHLDNLLNLIETTAGQFFITTIEESNLSLDENVGEFFYLSGGKLLE